jgi:nitrite reductase/ring-hydroxylating ferredoxin subunit
LCKSCDEYIYAAEKACPHCGSATGSKIVADEKLGLDVRTTIDEIERRSGPPVSSLSPLRSYAVPRRSAIANRVPWP